MSDEQSPAWFQAGLFLLMQRTFFTNIILRSIAFYQ
jgi:hypothetical protein